MLASVQAQKLTFTLHEHLIIGDDEEAPSEYLFYYPQIVRTDSQGNIYVKDARSAEKDVNAPCKEAVGAGHPELVSALESRPRELGQVAAV